jgi:uncharacterized protein (TIGR03437 family)
LTGDQSAGSAHLPTSLGGIQVSINGLAAPLSYIGSDHINGQVPYETTAGGAIAQVITNGISSTQLQFQVSPIAPRIISGDGNLCVAQNEDRTLNSEGNPAKAGRYIGAYLIGLGAVNPSIPSGTPARAVPLSTPPGPVSASLGGRKVIPTFLGMVPGLVGLGEVDLLVPFDLTGGLHGLSVTVGNVTSNTCQIALGK